jgi:hypothetical protein
MLEVGPWSEGPARGSGSPEFARNLRALIRPPSLSSVCSTRQEGITQTDPGLYLTQRFCPCRRRRREDEAPQRGDTATEKRRPKVRELRPLRASGPAPGPAAARSPGGRGSPPPLPASTTAASAAASASAAAAAAAAAAASAAAATAAAAAAAAASAAAEDPGGSTAKAVFGSAPAPGCLDRLHQQPRESRDSHPRFNQHQPRFYPYRDIERGRGCACRPPQPPQVQG